MWRRVFLALGAAEKPLCAERSQQSQNPLEGKARGEAHTGLHESLPALGKAKMGSHWCEYGTG